MAKATNVATQPPAESGAVRLKHSGLKGKKLTLWSGEVQVDKDGFFEVDAKEAERLLAIPGFEKG